MYVYTLMTHTFIRNVTSVYTYSHSRKPSDRWIQRPCTYAYRYSRTSQSGGNSLYSTLRQYTYTYTVPNGMACTRVHIYTPYTVLMYIRSLIRRIVVPIDSQHRGEYRRQYRGPDRDTTTPTRRLIAYVKGGVLLRFFLYFTFDQFQQCCCWGIFFFIPFHVKESL